RYSGAGRGPSDAPSECAEGCVGPPGSSPGVTKGEIGDRWSGPNRNLVRSAREERGRVDRGGAAAEFEVELRAGDRAGHADRADGIAASDLGAALHRDVAQVGIGRDVAVGVADEDE